MPMYNLLEYNKNFSNTSGSLWNYYRDQLTDETNDDNGPNKSVINSESFNYKTSIAGSTYKFFKKLTDENGNFANNPNHDRRKRGTKEVEIVVPLKYLSNFWKTLDMLLVNCEVSLTLSWSATYVITSMEKRVLVAGQPNRGGSSTSATFKITDTKLYIPVVILSTESDNKLLQQLKTGFKRTIKWNKYRSEMSNQTRNNNSNYLIDPTFTNVNRLFVLSLENEEHRTSYAKYYIPKIEIKVFNLLIDGKPFFGIPVKNKEQAYEAIIEMSKNKDYTTGNLSDLFSKHYRLIAIDLSKRIELENPDLKQQINFIGRLEEKNTAMWARK